MNKQEGTHTCTEFTKELILILILIFIPSSFVFLHRFIENGSRMIVYLTRRMRFNAAHKLWVADWSAEKNRAIFGKCSNRNWHGHNYELFVTVKGEPDPVTGFVMDAKALKDLVKKVITDKLDHSNLNLDVDFIPKGMQPTTENLAVLIWQQLEPHLTECNLHCIRLHETENISAAYYGE